MEKKRTSRKSNNPIVALIYDFDGTLAPGNMQEYSFIKAVGREIEEFCEDEEENYKPATPLGYRDYSESRLIGIKNILSQFPAVDLTNDKFHHLKRKESGIKKYDKIKTDVGDFIVTGDDETNYYVVNQEGKLFSVEYDNN